MLTGLYIWCSGRYVINRAERHLLYYYSFLITKSEPRQRLRHQKSQREVKNAPRKHPQRYVNLNLILSYEFFAKITEHKNKTNC